MGFNKAEEHRQDLPRICQKPQISAAAQITVAAERRAFDRPDRGLGHHIDKAQNEAPDKAKGLRAKGFEQPAANRLPAHQRRMAVL